MQRHQATTKTPKRFTAARWERFNVQITSKKQKGCRPLLLYWLEISSRISSAHSHTHTHRHTHLHTQTIMATHNLFLRVTARKPQTGKKKELRDRFSTTKIFTKPKNTQRAHIHQPKHVLLLGERGTLFHLTSQIRRNTQAFMYKI